MRARSIRFMSGGAISLPIKIGGLWNSSIGALAHLGLGRAYALSGDTRKAKSAYQNFLTIWKDANPDMSMLKQARPEYAKLQ